MALTKDGTHAALAEVNSETDFVARNPAFQSLVTRAAASILSHGYSKAAGMGAGGHVSLLDAESFGKVDALEAAATSLTATVRENITLRRAATLVGSGPGTVFAYVHNAVPRSPRDGGGNGNGNGNGNEDGDTVTSTASSTVPAAASFEVRDPGQRAAVVALVGGTPASRAEFGPRLAMHIVAMRPLYLDGKGVPREVEEEMRGVFAEQARQTGKPAAVVEKMVTGRLRKWVGETCLLAQPWVMDPDISVAAAMAAQGGETGEGGPPPLRAVGFVRFEAGEGATTD